MKNNKGFSLVELIIVIAIMAILVGVMAPQLIKYIEKANVSADTQICDSVRTAVQTTVMDPAIVTDRTYKDVTASATTSAGYTYSSVSALCGASGCSAFTKNIEELLSVTAGSNVDQTLAEQLKSHGAKDVAKTGFRVHFGEKGSNIVVFIPNTDASGAKATTNTAPSTTTANSCIYAGTIVGGETW